MSKIRFDIITIFPEIFDSYFNESIIKRAKEKKKVEIKTHNLRDFSSDKKHHKVDDRPFGGGAGMVLQAEPILRAYERIFRQSRRLKGSGLRPRASEKESTKIIIFSAKGRQFNQKIAYDWAKKYDKFIFITGRYEGIDERVAQITKAEEIAIGPYVLTDGDVATMVVVSAITRLIPGVIKGESLEEESFFREVIRNEAASGELEYPHYTRPEILNWKGKKYKVPPVLLTGNHKKIEEWRNKKRKAHK